MADAAVETAPADENDDNWLYGESTNDQSGTDSTRIDDKEKKQGNIADRNAVIF